jgi:hypothetical protein
MDTARDSMLGRYAARRIARPDEEPALTEAGRKGTRIRASITRKG